MALWSTFTNGSAQTAPSATNIIDFGSLAASDLSITTTSATTMQVSDGVKAVTFNINPKAFASSFFAFADGSKVMLGDNAAAATADDSANSMTGTGFGDWFDGFAGDDVMTMGAGNDKAYGNVGNDRLLGQAGNDVLSGGDGDDTVLGGAGNDQISGGAGNDVLLAGSGDDTVTPGTGNDIVSLGTGGSDLLVIEVTGNDGVDTVYDFVAGADKIRLTSNGATLTNAAEIQAALDGAAQFVSGGDLQIYFENGTQLTLKGVAAALTVADVQDYVAPAPVDAAPVITLGSAITEDTAAEHNVTFNGAAVTVTDSLGTSENFAGKTMTVSLTGAAGADALSLVDGGADVDLLGGATAGTLVRLADGKILGTYAVSATSITVTFDSVTEIRPADVEDIVNIVRFTPNNDAVGAGNRAANVTFSLTDHANNTGTATVAIN